MEYDEQESPEAAAGEEYATVMSAPPKRPAGRTKFRETRHPVYRGVRRRGPAGRWVCEVREPNQEVPHLARHLRHRRGRRARAPGPRGLPPLRRLRAPAPRRPATLATPEDIRRAAIELAEASAQQDAAAAVASSSSGADEAAPMAMAMHHQQQDAAPYDYAGMYGNMDFDQPYYYDGMGGAAAAGGND
ncbi:hypothetical protein C2845_PM09G01220 [Panicum miliaceum]|uniref:AP2/ERF domain-containing protein n=1 Tax=Panicum miliaceum TaxID=4540 RepID=A0A3L6S2M9_PANMI|nr:hypothetical protein C2845_PM09G01220 [Panicum miliaceum]